MRKQLIKAKRAKKLIKADWVDVMDYKKGFCGWIHNGLAGKYKNNEEGC